MPIFLLLRGMRQQDGRSRGGERLFFTLLRFFLELYVQFDSYSLLVYSRIVAVGEASHIVDAQHSEDVLDAYGNLDVGGRVQIVVRVILVWEFE